MTGRSNLEAIHMGTDHVLLLRREMGLGENKDDAKILISQPKKNPLQTCFIAVGRRPWGYVGNADKSF
jgi:hypothetical protein